jgi:hypothetical protein
MTTVALLNEPRCLDLATFALTPPREVPDLGPKSRPVWGALRSKGGTSRFRKYAARESLDTVAVLRAYREPLPGEVWTLPMASERRLLAQVNAILVLGHEALKQVVDLGIDADLPDPGRVFASLFVLGCIAGPAWLQSMLSIFVAAVERNPAEGAAAIEALSLAPNADVLEGVALLLDDERPKIRAAAIRVLSFRAVLRPSQWIRAIEDMDGAVATAAASAPLAGVDRDRCRQPLERLLHHRSEGLVRAALRAGLTLRLEAAHRRAREISRSDPGWADALQYLAMFGLRADEDAIRAALMGPKWLSAVRAAALSGRTALVPDLLALMSQVETAPDQKKEIARALNTITGLPLSAAEDSAAAASLWAQNQDRFDSQRRYRHGRRFHPSVLLQSLRLDEGANTDSRLHLRESRQQSYLELVAATDGRVPRFSAYDFVARQSISLQRVKSWLDESIDPNWVAGPLH